MSVPEAEPRTEWGVCPVCGRYAEGRFLEDLTPYTAVVEHCASPNQPNPGRVS